MIYHNQLLGITWGTSNILSGRLTKTTQYRCTVCFGKQSINRLCVHYAAPMRHDTEEHHRCQPSASLLMLEDTLC